MQRDELVSKVFMLPVVVPNKILVWLAAFSCVSKPSVEIVWCLDANVNQLIEKSFERVVVPIFNGKTVASFCQQLRFFSQSINQGHDSSKLSVRVLFPAKLVSCNAGKERAARPSFD